MKYFSIIIFFFLTSVHLLGVRPFITDDAAITSRKEIQIAM